MNSTNRPVFLLFLLMILSLGLQAQSQVFIDPDTRWYMNRGKNHNRDLVFFYYPYMQENLDLRDFKEKLGEGGTFLPDQFPVTAPEALEKGRSIFAVSILKEEGGSAEALIALFIDQDSLGNVYYFIDRNMDQNYQNDGPPLQMNTNSAPQKVVVQKEAKRSPIFMFSLLPPEPETETETIETKKAEPSPWILPTDKEELANLRATLAKNSRFALRLNASYGFERLEWNYINNSSGYPTTYDVTSSNKALGLQLNYRWKFIRFGLRSSLESLFYWTSHKETRLGEPYEYCDGNSCTYFENVLQESGKDLLPRGRINAGINVEFAIPLDARLSLSPYGSVGFSQYLNPEYTPNRFKPEETIKINREPYFETGAIFEFFAINGNSLALQLSWRTLDFAANDYFESLDISGLKKKNSGFWVSIGYGIGLR